jgi:hypothetical protein
MTRRRSLVLLVLSGCALLVVAGILAPRFINQDALRERVAGQLSTALGAEVKVRALRVFLLPLPHVVLRGVSVSRSGVVDGTAASVSLVPSLGPLLRGEVQPAKVSLKLPDVTLQLPRRSPAANAVRTPGSLAELNQTLATVLAAVSTAVASRAPGLVVEVTDGQVTLAAVEAPAVTVGNIHALLRLPPNQLVLDLTCTSNLWDSLSLRASFTPTSLSGSGQIRLQRLRPQVITPLLLHGSSLRLGDSEATIALQFTTSGSASLEAEIEGVIPKLTVQRGAETLVIRGDHLKASARVGDSATAVVLNELQLQNPALRLSGSMTLDERAPLARVQLDARDVDVSSVRHAATVLAGPAPVARAIFDVLRSGRVPRFTLDAQGPAPADLGDLDAIAIRGTLDHGRIHVPGIELDLDEVAGNAAVTDGVLIGDHATAQLGTIQASDGALRLGLAGAAPELHVETSVHADAAEVPALLKRLVASQALSRQLDRFSDVHGTAAGTLRLDGTTTDVTTAVDVSQLHVSGLLRGMSQPLKIDGGRLHYDGRAIAVADMQVTAGTSTLSQLSARVDWEQAPSLSATAGRARLVLDEMYPWLGAAGWSVASAWDLKSVKGTVDLDALQVRGPLDSPSDWQVELKGAAHNLAVESPAFQQRTALRYPVSLSNVRLSQDPASGTSFSASVTGVQGLSGSIDLLRTPEALHVKKLSVRDADSDASLSLLLKSREFDLTFAGSLSRRTVDALVVDNPLIHGWVRGDFRAQIPMDQPSSATAVGRLEASDVVLPNVFNTPLRIETASLRARAGGITVSAAIDAGAGGRARLKGQVKPSPRAFVADVDLTTDRIDWNTIAAILGRGDGGRSTAAASSWRVPLRGTVRVAADSFTYNGFTWQPLRAAITLAADGPKVRMTGANLCGITTPGTIRPTPRGLSLRFNPTAKDQELDSSLACLTQQVRLATGRYGLTANLAAHGEPSELLRSLQGHVDFTAKAGRIYHVNTIAKVLSVVSIATGSLENIADLTTAGLPYDTYTVKGDIRGGTLVLDQAVLDGPSVKIVSEGSIDLNSRTCDLTLLVAPLRSVDKVIGRIPIVGDVLGGSLVSIPVKVTGSWTEPTVTPLSPSAVGESLLNGMKRTLKLPMRVIQPLFPGEGKK